MKKNFLLISLISMLIACNPKASYVDSEDNNNQNMNNPTPGETPHTPVTPTDPSAVHYTNLISEVPQYDGEIISNIRIRGFILPESKLSTTKMLLSVSPGIQGTAQKYLRIGVYDSFIDKFSEFWKYQNYDVHLITTHPLTSYQSGAKISFNPDTYEVIMDGNRIPFENNIRGSGNSQNILTPDKKWRLGDIDWLKTNVVTAEDKKNYPDPAVGSQYYILWMLEGYIFSNGEDKMIVRIIAQDMHERSLYTVVP